MMIPGVQKPLCMYLPIHTHDDAGSTEAALDAAVVCEALLYRVIALPLAAQTLYGGYVPAMDRVQEAQTLPYARNKQPTYILRKTNLKDNGN